MAINTIAMMLDGRAAPPWWCSFLEVDGLSMYYSYEDEANVGFEIQK